MPEPYLGYLKLAANGDKPFVYIKGSSVTLVDAAKHDLAAGNPDVDMTVPDNFPLGAYTVRGVIKDLAGNPTTVTLILHVSGDRTAPVLTVSQVKADGATVLAGNLKDGYTLPTTNVATLDHTLQWTASVEPLQNAYFGLTLVAAETTVSAAQLEAYYTARGVPEPYLGYLKLAANGDKPFVYIKGSSVTLVDAAKHDLAAGNPDVDMTVPDNFPLGTYTVRGVIQDLAGNPTTVTLILHSHGDRTAPVLDLHAGQGQRRDHPGGHSRRRLHPADHQHRHARPHPAVRPPASNRCSPRTSASSSSPAETTRHRRRPHRLTTLPAACPPTPTSPTSMARPTATKPFVLHQGQQRQPLVDAAKHDHRAAPDADMTVPDNFPLGTYTVQGVIQDLAGNATTVTLILHRLPATAPPRCLPSPASRPTASTWAVSQGPATPCRPPTSRRSTTCCSSDRPASQRAAADAYFGLTLVAYHRHRRRPRSLLHRPSVPEPYLAYLKAAADGDQALRLHQGHQLSRSSMPPSMTSAAPTPT